MISPVILFVPVSSTKGIGEYNRSIIIAETIKQVIPGAKIHFVLNKHVKYKRDCPFPIHYSDHSATKDTAAVISAINNIKPNLAIFDCAGRARQYAAAKSVGAKVIFISQHRRKRALGINFRRQMNIDLHWVVQPDFAIEPLTWLEKFKLQLMKKPQPLNIGPILPCLQPREAKALLHRYKLFDKPYFLFSCGSGGHEIDGRLGADLFYEAAIEFQRKSGIKCFVVFGENYPNELPIRAEVICVKSLASTDFITLLNAAAGRVLSAGDTLLQAICLQKPSVGVAVSKDQPIRLKKCANKGLVIACQADLADILDNAALLLSSSERENIAKNLNNQRAEFGLDVVINQIKKLLDDHR